jgi:hypothetical protein
MNFFVIFKFNLRNIKHTKNKTYRIMAVNRQNFLRVCPISALPVMST